MIVGGTVILGGLIYIFSHAGSGKASDSSANPGSLSSTSSSGGTGHGAPGTAGRGEGGLSGAARDGKSQPQKSGTSFLASPNYHAALEVAGMADGPTRTEAMEALIETWAANDPGVAADWAGSLPAGNFRDDAMSALMFHWGLSAPAEAAAWMARTGIDDPEAVSALAGRWAATDAAAASSWAASQTDPLLRHDAILAVAGAWAGPAPQAAAAWVASLPAAERPGATTTLIATWADSDPAAAAAWLGQQPDAGQESQLAAVSVLATVWAESNPGAVSKYINSLPEGPVREAASSQFAIAAAPNAPAEALTWAMNLTDPLQRNQVVADVCESWYDGAPEGFRSGISDAFAFMEGEGEMRKGVYEMLYERDPAFHDNLLQLVDKGPPSAAPFSPASVENFPSTRAQPADPFATVPAATVPPVTPIYYPPAIERGDEESADGETLFPQGGDEGDSNP